MARSRRGRGHRTREAENTKSSRRAAGNAIPARAQGCASAWVVDRQAGALDRRSAPPPWHGSLQIARSHRFFTQDRGCLDGRTSPLIPAAECGGQQPRSGADPLCFTVHSVHFWRWCAGWGLGRCFPRARPRRTWRCPRSSPAWRNVLEEIAVVLQKEDRVRSVDRHVHSDRCVVLDLDSGLQGGTALDIDLELRRVGGLVFDQRALRHVQTALVRARQRAELRAVDVDLSGGRPGARDAMINLELFLTSR